MKKKIVKRRIKNKFKYKRNLKKKQKKSKLKIIFKPTIIFILFLSYVGFYSLDTNIPVPKVFNETEAFREILAFEKNII